MLVWPFARLRCACPPPLLAPRRLGVELLGLGACALHERAQHAQQRRLARVGVDGSAVGGGGGGGGAPVQQRARLLRRAAQTRLHTLRVMRAQRLHVAPPLLHRQLVRLVQHECRYERARLPRRGERAARQLLPVLLLRLDRLHPRQHRARVVQVGVRDEGALRLDKHHAQAGALAAQLGIRCHRAQRRRAQRAQVGACALQAVLHRLLLVQPWVDPLHRDLEHVAVARGGGAHKRHARHFGRQTAQLGARRLQRLARQLQRLGGEQCVAPRGRACAADGIA
eukprot:4985367-Pleurochrysis_carterae.AAC.1